MSHERRSLPDAAASVFQTVCVRVRTAEIVRQRGVVNAYVERLLTVVATCRQQGRPLLDFLVAAGEAALHGTAAPSLRAAPRRG